MFPFSWSCVLSLPPLDTEGKVFGQFFPIIKSPTEFVFLFYHFSCCCSVDKSILILCEPLYCMPGYPVHHHLSEISQTYVHWVSDAIQPSHPLLLPSPPAFYLSQHQSLSDELAFLILWWPKYWSFSFSPSNGYSEFISFRIDWFDLCAVQGTLKSLLQHPSWKRQFFGTQPSLWSISHIHTWLLEKP